MRALGAALAAALLVAIAPLMEGALAQGKSKAPAATPPIAPMTGLPGQATAQWRSDGKGLDILILLKDNGVAAPSVDRFLEAGGHFSRADVTFDNKSTDATYDPNTNTIKVSASDVAKDGSYPRRASPTLIATAAHEFWHAYRHQIVEEGYDPATKTVFDKATKWLEKQKIRPRGGGKVEIAGEKWWFNEAEFLDEYIGQIINRLVPIHLGIRTRLKSGAYTAAVAADRWTTALGRTYTSKFQGYEDAGADQFDVLASPPKYLFDRLIAILGLGFKPPAPIKTSARPSQLADEVAKALSEFPTEDALATAAGVPGSPDIRPELDLDQFGRDQNISQGVQPGISAPNFDTTIRVEGLEGLQSQ